MTPNQTGREEHEGEKQKPEPRRARKAAKFGWSLYQQVAAVFAAIGLAALVDHWWHIGWRGALGSLVGVWSHTVRPAVAAVFHVVVTVPPGWIRIHFEVPVAARDYMSIDLILALSTIRVRGWLGHRALKLSQEFEWRWDVVYPMRMLYWPPLIFAFWPLLLLLDAWFFWISAPWKHLRGTEVLPFKGWEDLECQRLHRGRILWRRAGEAPARLSRSAAPRAFSRARQRVHVHRDG